MNEQIFKGNWNEIKGKLKEQWGKLTNDQLTEIEGNNDSIYGFLQKQYGYTKEKAKEQVEAFLKDNAGQLKAFVQNLSEGISNQVAHIPSQVKNFSAASGEVLTEKVKENPLLSLGVAFGAGLLLGIFLKK